MRLLTLVVLLGGTKICGAASYAGLRLGMSYSEVTQSMKEKGFREFYDFQTHTMNGKPMSEEQFRALPMPTDPTRKNFMCVHRSYPENVPVEKRIESSLVCSTSPLVPQPILMFMSSFRRGILYRFHALLNPELASASLKGILKEFGIHNRLEKAGVEVLSDNSLMQSWVQNECLEGCQAMSWRSENSPELTQVIFQGQNPNHGKGVILKLVNLPTDAEVHEAWRKNFGKDAEAKAKSVGI